MTVSLACPNADARGTKTCLNHHNMLRLSPGHFYKKGARVIFIKSFSELGLDDVKQVGGKNASLGYLIHVLRSAPCTVPHGFATTSQAYWHFMHVNHLKLPIEKLMAQVTDPTNTVQLKRASTHIRKLIEQAPIPTDLQQTIIENYTALAHKTVAVRSSATAEDLPTASFAGQHESFLNIRGTNQVLTAWKRCVSSLFTPRAIAYRLYNNIDYRRVALAVGIQEMVVAKTSGVLFTLDTESGFPDVIAIAAARGFGEQVVQGTMNPDEYYVHKPRLLDGYAAILNKTRGSTTRGDATRGGATHGNAIKKFCLADRTILALARIAITIEQAYKTPMDIEWVQTPHGALSIVQARPETVHARQKPEHTIYRLDTKNARPLITGQAVGQHIASGRVQLVASIHDAGSIKNGDILVTTMTSPDWVPLMKKAAAIITDRGGRTCHAAIVSRELGIPALVGTLNATRVLHNNQTVTVDCHTGSLGTVYNGILNYTTKKIILKKLPKSPVPLMLNIGQPTTAFACASLPVSGVGLARTEFIIANDIGIHPLALINYQKLPKTITKQISARTAAYSSPTQFFIHTLAQQVATIAAAFWPKPVFVRLSDFKSNEYRHLLGGQLFEPAEDNPMLGMRGAARYINQQYRAAVKLECAALRYARTVKGFSNIHVMIPFVRTIEEAHAIKQVLKHERLSTKNQVKNIMMCETPANALLIKDFCTYFDGFSIGSNDLTQLTLGIDRDCEQLACEFDEQNAAVKQLIQAAITGAHAAKKTIGICGQAPSDYHDFCLWLIKNNIDYISLNADAVIPFLLRLR